MKTLILLGTLFLSILSLAPAFAHETGIEAEYPFAYATSEKQKNGAVYFTIRNMTRQSDRLLSASTPIASMTELHTITIAPNEEMQMDVTSMKKMDFLDIPEMSSLYFDPLGRHVMLMGLTKPLKSGEMFPLTLTFEKTGPITIDVMVLDNSYEIDVEGGEHWMPREEEHEHEDHEHEHGHEHDHGDHQH